MVAAVHGYGEAGRASITEVACRAGVSLGTVSRVMNGHGSVHADLRRRVLTAARAIGFVPRTQQRHLAVLVGRRNPRLPVGYTHVMSALIQEFAYAAGRSVELFDAAHVERAYDCRVEAAIGVVFDDGLAQLCQVPHLPVVAINHPMADRGIHSVYSDHYEQGQLATRHLVDLGHRRIAFLGNLPDEHGDRERLRGYRDVLAEAGATPADGDVRFAGDGPVYDTVRRWTRSGVTAILNLSEDVVPEVLHVLGNVLNLRIGRDISTISLEDVPLYQYFSPPQTVIRQPLRELARLAVEQALKNPPAGEAKRRADVLDLCLHGELVVRESTGPVAGAHRVGRERTAAKGKHRGRSQ